MERVTRERVLELVSYEPDTGIFRRKVARVGCHGVYPIGSIAGGLNAQGYRLIWIDKAHPRAARLAWFIMQGEWPPCQVDHKNRIRWDDRWDNLRLATNRQNAQNRGLRSNNTSGFNGVSYDPKGKCYRAQVRINGKQTWLRGRPTAEEAFAERCKVTEELHGEFACNERKIA